MPLGRARGRIGREGRDAVRVPGRRRPLWVNPLQSAVRACASASAASARITDTSAWRRFPRVCGRSARRVVAGSGVATLFPLHDSQK